MGILTNRFSDTSGSTDVYTSVTSVDPDVSENLTRPGRLGDVWNSFIKSIKKPVRAQNYRYLHFTLTMILMISNIYDIYKKNKNKYR